MIALEIVFLNTDISIPHGMDRILYDADALPKPSLCSSRACDNMDIDILFPENKDDILNIVRQ